MKLAWAILFALLGASILCLASSIDADDIVAPAAVDNEEDGDPNAEDNPNPEAQNYPHGLGLSDLENARLPVLTPEQDEILVPAFEALEELRKLDVTSDDIKEDFYKYTAHIYKTLQLIVGTPNDKEISQYFVLQVITESLRMEKESGHVGRFGHEFIEFEVNGDGLLRYANNTSYRKDGMIRKQACLSQTIIDQIKKIINDAEILKEDDAKWPEKDESGRQELEIRFGRQHISFQTSKIGSLAEIQESDDPDGLR
ncbi:hypothetical protein H4219_004466, partial [Mycoemilia scoparia]